MFQTLLQLWLLVSFPVVCFNSNFYFFITIRKQSKINEIFVAMTTTITTTTATTLLTILQTYKFNWVFFCFKQIDLKRNILRAIKLEYKKFSRYEVSWMCAYLLTRLLFQWSVCLVVWAKNELLNSKQMIQSEVEYKHAGLI